jgi:hypothetical protein
MEQKEVEVAVEEVLEKSVFAIGDPFTSVKFPREKGVDVCCHPNFFYATDSTGSFLDPVSTIMSVASKAPKDGDEIIVNIGEMDLMYRIARSSDGSFFESAAAIGSAVASLVRTFSQKYPNFMWSVCPLSDDASFDAFYQKERAAFGSSVPAMPEERASSRSKLRVIVNLMIREELAGSSIRVLQ